MICRREPNRKVFERKWSALAQCCTTPVTGSGWWWDSSNCWVSGRISLGVHHGLERALDASLQVSKYLQDIQQTVRVYRR
jgi:hypothetical protein